MTQGQDIWRQKVALFRRKFGSREDLFSTKYYYNIPMKDEEGRITAWERKGIFHPNCTNYGNQSLCLISQRKGGCSDCANKIYGTLTDEWLYRHITGREEIVLFMLQEHGIKFGAVDFDELNPLKDAVLVRDYLEKLGIKSYIARSSKKGYHLYTFFSEVVPAHLYTSLIRKCFQDLGIYARAQESGKFYIPEVFPKQIAFSPDNIGNGIKPPMIETRFEEGFNCWVKDDGSPIDKELQWHYLRDTVDITLDQLNEVIKTWEVEVIEAPVRRGKSAAAREANGGSKRPQGTEKWAASEVGDFTQVMSKCAAFRQFWEKDDDGNYKFDKSANEHGVPHTARVASLAMAIRTKNGIDIIRQRWGSERTEKEIDYATRTNQRPWTCSAMQQNGICRVGQHPQHNDHCFQKRPPMERVNGKWVAQDVPEAEWPEPSPIRFGNEGGPKKSPEELLEDLEKVFQSSDPEETKRERIASLIKVKASFSIADQKKIDNYITKNRKLTKSELNEFNKAAKKELNEEKVAQARDEHPSFFKNGKTYLMRDGKYWIITVDAKGNAHDNELTNFVIEFSNEIAKIDSVDNLEESDGKGIKERIVDGYIYVNDQKHYFRTKYEEWLSKADSFAALLLREGGLDMEFSKANFEDIKLCIQRFGKAKVSRRKRLSELGHVIYKEQDMYFMPSVIVSKDGVKTTQDFDVKFDDEYGSQYDFGILEDDKEFKELSMHILQDYFNCNSRIAAMTCFAHAMAAGIMHLIPLDRNPILWIMGNQGSGKSFIAQIAQCFYGNFKTYISMTSTEKGKLYRAATLKDVLYLIDDYKKTLVKDKQGFMQFLQQSYDRTSRDRASKDGDLKGGLRCKGLLLITGEEPTEDEASTIARMLLVNCESKQDTVLGERVRERKHLYRSFTPQFIHYAYNLELSWVKQVYNEYTELFNADVKEEYENTLRVSQNLAHNMTAFRFAMDMLVNRGVIDTLIRESLIREHVHNLRVIRTTVLNHMKSQKGSEIFLSGLRDLLSDHRHFCIDGLPEDEERYEERRNAKPLGFCRDTDPDYVFVYPHQSHSEVAELLRKSGNYLQAKSKLGRELHQDGYIVPNMFDPSCGSIFTKQVTGPDKKRHHVWVLKREALGLSSNLKVAQKTPPKPPISPEDESLADLLGGTK